VLSDFLARGDFDRNGTLTAADISAMLQALTDLNQFKTTNSLSDDELNAIGDLDGSGSITNVDIQCLIDLIANGSLSSSSVPQAVPEPSASILAVTLLLALTTAPRHSRPKLCI
jgi:hypothetical protein